MSTFGEALIATFGERARRNLPLAPLTTFRVGGPAEWLVEAESATRGAIRALCITFATEGSTIRSSALVVCRDSVRSVKTRCSIHRGSLPARSDDFTDILVGLERRGCGYLWVMTYTPSQFSSGPETRYSLQRFRYMRAGPSAGQRSSNFSKIN